MNTKAVGKNIKQLMKQSSMDGLDICHKGGWTPDTVWNWISGKRQPSAYAVYKLSKMFGVPMEAVMEGVDE